MNDIYLVVIQKPAEIDDTKENLLSESLTSYNRFVNGKDDLEFRAIISHDIVDTYIEIYNLINGKDKYLIARICIDDYDENSIENTLFKKHLCNVIEKIPIDYLSNIEFLTCSLKSNLDTTLLDEITLFEIITKIHFALVVHTFSHGKTDDLVNSDLGLLKVWCDNSDESEKLYLKNGFIKKLKIEEIKTVLKNLKSKLDDCHSALIFFPIKNETIKCKSYIDNILKNIDEDACIINNKEELSDNISSLFDFISKYRVKV